MRARLATVLLAATLVAPAAVSAGPAEDSMGCDPIDPSRCLLPWPSDHFTRFDPTTDTRRRLSLNAAQMPRNIAGVPIDPSDYNRNDGFSPGTMIVTRVPGLDTPQAYASTAPAPITDPGQSLDPDAPVMVLDAATAEPHPVWVELDLSEAIAGDARSPENTVLQIRPAVNLAEGHRYVVALRNLKDANGNLIPAQEPFRKVRDADQQDDGRFADIFPVLDRAGIARDETLYLSWDFTVASERNLSERMLYIRDAAFGELGDTNLADLRVRGAAPRFVVDEVTQALPCRPTIDIDVPPVSCEAQEKLDERLFRRVEGRVFVPCFLDQPGCPSGSKFRYATPDATLPVRIPGNVAAANFVCNIPAGAADGWTFRPSLYGHGLFGEAAQVNTWKLYEMGDDGLMFCATDWIGMAFEDIPNALTITVELGRFSTLADRMQQAMLNFLYLGRALIHPNGLPSHPAFQVDGHSVIDTSRLFYNGGSQGGIVGGSLTAVAPDFTRAHLGVPAMNYSTLLRRSVDFDIFAEFMYNAYPDPIERSLIIAMIQTLWDRAESNGYAHHMTVDPYANTPAHQVLLTPAFGDHQVTNWATEVMARTVGAKVRAPYVDPGRYPGGDDGPWGFDRLEAEDQPYVGSVMVMSEIGPLRPCPDPRGDVSCRSGFAGTDPPPIDEVPNRTGVDPHGPDWSERPEGIAAIAAFLAHDGAFSDTCDPDIPCYLAGWTGP